MNLADMLCYADIQQLSSIARTYDCECNGNSKNELIQSILSMVNRREVLERHVNGMSIEDIRFLNSLVFDQRDSFSLEELVARAQLANISKPDEKWNPRDTIARLKQRGWLFNGFSQHTRYLFQLPNDLKKRFTETLAASFEPKLQYTDEPEVYRDEQRLIAEDLYSFLRYLHQQEAELTSDGAIYKRHLLQLLGTLSVPEEPVAKGAWRFGYGRKYRDLPARLSFLYDYSYHNGLIAEQPGKLSLTDRGEAWVLENRREDMASLYRFWLKLYKGPIPNLPSLAYWIGRLAKEWVTEQTLGDVLCQLIRPFYYDDPASIYGQRILPMMLHLGLIRFGESEEAGKVIRVTKMGASLIAGTYVAEEETIPIEFDNKPPFIL